MSAHWSARNMTWKIINMVRSGGGRLSSQCCRFDDRGTFGTIGLGRLNVVAVPKRTDIFTITHNIVVHILSRSFSLLYYSRSLAVGYKMRFQSYIFRNSSPQTHGRTSTSPCAFYYRASAVCLFTHTHTHRDVYIYIYTKQTHTHLCIRIYLHSDTHTHTHTDAHAPCFVRQQLPVS